SSIPQSKRSLKTGSYRCVCTSTTGEASTTSSICLAIGTRRASARIVFIQDHAKRESLDAPSQSASPGTHERIRTGTLRLRGNKFRNAFGLRQPSAAVESHRLFPAAEFRHATIIASERSASRSALQLPIKGAQGP